MHATQQPTARPTPGLAQPLRDAADYLDRHGWCQHDFYTDRTSPTPAADIVGALAIVCFGFPTTDVSFEHIPTDDLIDAEKAFLQAARILGAFVGLDDMVDADGNRVDYSLSDFNDEPYQSIGAITAVLRAAADEHEQTGGVA